MLLNQCSDMTTAVRVRTSLKCESDGSGQMNIDFDAFSGEEHSDENFNSRKLTYI